jgi:hypothetical protein
MIRTIEFSRFRACIAALPIKDRYEKRDLLREDFLLFSEDGLDVYYVPFHRMNCSARVALVGLTPGWAQMELAYRTAKKALADGLPDEDIFERVDLAGSFAGPMRANLVGMLDGIGLNRHLCIPSCATLFGDSSALGHFTSAISAPIFKNRENYTGYGPSVLNLPNLIWFITQNLAWELKQLPSAVVIPLGKAAGEIVQFLNERHLIRPERCLIGFPHPSGANGHRRPLYECGRETWRRQLAEWFTRDPRSSTTRVDTSSE